MRKILLLIGRLLRMFFGGITASFFERCRDLIYTGYHAKQFSSFMGRKIEYPADQIIGHHNISIGKGTLISKHIVLTAFEKRNNQQFQPYIEIGQSCIMGEYMHITAVGNIRIGNNVLTGRYCLITDNSHGVINKEEMSIPPIDRILTHKDVSIGNNVWLGDSVRILPGVSIGDGCVIGTGSVVTKDIPSYCVAAGVPARIIKNLNEITS